MIKLVVFVMITVALVLLSLFVNGLMELYKQEQEEKKNTVRGGMDGYLDNTFGMGAAKVFKSIIDAEGTVRYVVYLPQYEWFKSPQYQWFEVFETDNGYQHTEMAS